jgi:hypothetical protein
MLGDLSHSLAGEIVFCGADAAGRDDDLGSMDGSVDGFFHPLEVVANGGGMDQLDPVFRKRFGNGGGIRVNNLAQEEFRSNSNDFSMHRLSQWSPTGKAHSASVKYPPMPRLWGVVRQKRNPPEQQYFDTWMIQARFTHLTTAKARNLHAEVPAFT